MESAADAADRTKRIVAAVLQVPETDVQPSSVLNQLAELDSLSLAEIASALDDEFGIRIPSESLRPTASVADLIAVVEQAKRR